MHAQLIFMMYLVDVLLVHTEKTSVILITQIVIQTAVQPSEHKAMNRC